MGIKKPCPGKYGTCTNLIDKDKQYCDECLPNEIDKQKQKAKDYDSQRGTAASRGYNHRWQKVRLKKIRRDPICEKCLQNGIIKQADLVHHIDENPHNNTMDNLMSLCNDCHEKIHKRFHK